MEILTRENIKEIIEAECLCHPEHDGAYIINVDDFADQILDKVRSNTKDYSSVDGVIKVYLVTDDNYHLSPIHEKRIDEFILMIGRPEVVDDLEEIEIF